MSQVSSTLRRIEGGFAHWCPACEEMHRLPDGWSFDGNLESPSFTPSFKHDGIQRVFVDGHWTGEWKRDAVGNTVPFCCHYILTAGVLNFCCDCTHSFAGQSVPLPKLPEGLTDDD
jgi:hypothetical protein